MKITKTQIKQIIQEEVAKMVSGDTILALEQFDTSSFGGNPGAIAGDCPPGTKFVSGKGCVELKPPGNREEHPVGADRNLAYLMDNLGTMDNVAQVLELVAEDIPEFTERFKFHYDYLMS